MQVYHTPLLLIRACSCKDSSVTSPYEVLPVDFLGPATHTAALPAQRGAHSPRLAVRPPAGVDARPRCSTTAGSRIAGRFGSGFDAQANAELYDPASGMFTATDAMT